MLRRLRQNPSGGADIAYFDISHAGETYRINLKRTAAARRYTLRVRAAAHDVVLTMPTRGSLSKAKSFAERHAAWIGARLRRLPAKMRFMPGEVVPVRGVLHRIAHRPGARGAVRIEATAQDAHGGAEPLLWVNAEAAFVPRRVQDFLMREARRDIEAAVARHTAKLGVHPRKITLRDTTSRWGSCSSLGALNFSWRLIMAPRFVLDYLAAHEVAHLQHMNHSTAFWAVVAQLSPDIDAAEAWLKTHGASLLRFGPGKSDGN
ncbi:SprT family zinc-dependent metalloprotease [Methylocapsa polymorpha]|uniref:SprT family zinc-dependent metalloprotease n=1 Tax=Methylocapsa polymorpha TaxID=3080828 RepID=A0ABZ0HRF4_9HYPH|nr:SprT family zinc-dependent metalloprotease [Methylocapsa sp. RX1]